MIDKKYTLEIMFFSGTSLTSKLIQGFTQCKWNHVGVITRRTDEKVQVHEALANGLVKTTYTEGEIKQLIEDGRVEIKTLLVGMHPLDVEKRANAYEGRPYGWTDLIAIMFYRYLKPFGLHPLIKLFVNADKLICSEFTSRLVYDASYREIDFSKEYNKVYSLISPAEIYNSTFFLISHEIQHTLVDVDRF